MTEPEDVARMTDPCPRGCDLFDDRDDALSSGWAIAAVTLGYGVLTLLVGIMAIVAIAKAL